MSLAEERSGRPPQAASLSDAPPDPPQPAIPSGPQRDDKPRAGSAVPDRDRRVPASNPPRDPPSREGKGGGPTSDTAKGDDDKDEDDKDDEDDEDEDDEEDEDEVDGYVKPNLLNRVLGLEDAPVKVFGWVQGSFTANPRVSSNHENFGVNPNNLANAWSFQQMYLVAEKRVEQGDRPDLGFRFDNLFGNDWQNFHAVGLFDRAFAVDHVGYDPVQMYGEAHLPLPIGEGGLDIKGGRFYALPGYEEGMAPARPLLSTGYLFSYAHPFTHFGMMSTWHLTDRIELYNGAVNGWDRWINEHYKWGYAGGVSWDSRDERTNVTLTVNWGPDQISRDPATEAVPSLRSLATRPTVPGQRPLGFGGKDTALFTTTVSHEWTEDFSTILEADQAFQNAVPGIGPGGRPQNASWYGLAGWLLYDLSDHWTGVGRAEVFRDNNGVRTGFADTFYETTLGLIYRPKPWLWLRPEIRYDWSQKTHPYDDGRHRDQLTFGFDLIFLF